MPMSLRASLFAVAGVVLMLVWTGPLPAATAHSFAAHMTIHIAVVAIAAPAIALAVAGTRFDPVRGKPTLLAAVPISLIDLVVIWAWHAPAVHDAARRQTDMFVLEQASFLVAGTLLWVAAVGGDPEQRRLRAGAGVAALLFTSMHVVLLGALFALAGRPLFHADHSSLPAVVADQQLGGVIMLIVGGASYLAGGLWLTAVALRPRIRKTVAAGGRSS
jgi:putative membrane protein